MRTNINIFSSLCLSVIILLTLLLSEPAAAQGIATSEEGLRVEAVRITITNPGPSVADNQRIEDQVRRTLSLFPGERFSRESFEFMLSRARRSATLSDVDYTLDFGPSGGLVVEIALTIKEGSAGPDAKGLLSTKNGSDFPLLYDANGTFVKMKLELFGLHYSNTNAWYGRPDLMLAGNPLVVGEPSGKGYEDWIEAYLHFGVYGLTPISEKTYVYGSLSAMLTASTGQELFTDETRSYFGVEEAYIGFLTGNTTEQGNRWVLNANYGRQRFTLADGFLIANTALNGNDRAALQANARWAADALALIQYRYNETKVELFQVDPDELPILDSETKINGINIENASLPGLNLAASHLRVPQSNTNYFLPDGRQLSREGLRVYDLRARWQPKPAGLAGPFVAGEYAWQTNENFPMRAKAYFGEIGYAFAQAKWTPTFSYRYSSFSGDDASTPNRFERWDPLLSGGNGEQWVQGINHFKVVQIGNVQAQRFQLRLRPNPKVELVPQVWLFKADSTLNLGGNPALSFLDGTDYGHEINITAKYFRSRNLYLHGHIAVTFPGNAVKSALNGTQEKWWSTMFFARYAF
jgi:Alginate export